MAIEYTVQDEILREAIMSFQEEYKDLYDTWKCLDSKAQATATIAGIFLAAAFALAREIPVTFVAYQTVLLATSIALLVITVCLSLIGLQIRRIYAPPIGENSQKLIRDLLPSLSESERDARLSAFLGDRYRLWEQANVDFKCKSSGKARWVASAQGFLLAAIAVATTVTLSAVIN